MDEFKTCSELKILLVIHWGGVRLSTPAGDCMTHSHIRYSHTAYDIGEDAHCQLNLPT